MVVDCHPYQLCSSSPLSAYLGGPILLRTDDFSVVPLTPLKTNMALENLHFQKEIHHSSMVDVPACHVRFRGGGVTEQKNGFTNLALILHNGQPGF